MSSLPPAWDSLSPCRRTGGYEPGPAHSFGQRAGTSYTQLACECASTRDALRAIVELARGRLSPSLLNANSSPNLYLPEISRTRQTVRTLRHFVVYP